MKRWLCGCKVKKCSVSVSVAMKSVPPEVPLTLNIIRLSQRHLCVNHSKSIGAYALKTLMKPENEAEANAIKSVLEEHGIYA